MRSRANPWFRLPATEPHAATKLRVLFGHAGGGLHTFKAASVFIKIGDTEITGFAERYEIYRTAEDTPHREPPEPAASEPRPEYNYQVIASNSFKGGD